MAQGRFHLNDKFYIMGEGQLRAWRTFNDWFYHEYKGGCNYSLNSRVGFFLGLGNYSTYQTTGDFENPKRHEFRMWQEMNFKMHETRVRVEHRYRVEQRYLSTGYRNRFRYRLAAQLPLNSGSKEGVAFYLTAFDEIFLTNKPGFFERNRLYGGVGCKLGAVNFQVGMMNQMDYSISNGTTFKNFLMINTIFDFRKSKASSSPRLPFDES